MKKAIKIFTIALCVIMLLCVVGCGEKEVKIFNSLDDFETAKLGILVGSDFDGQTQTTYPNAKDVQLYNVADLLISLEQGKIDGFLLDEAPASALFWEKDNIKLIKGDIAENKYAYIIGKNDMGQKIKPLLNEFIREMNKSGVTAELAEKWTCGVMPAEFADYTELEGENGTIVVAASDTDAPMSFSYGNKAAGFEIELLTMFASEYGYKLDIRLMEFDAILSGISTNLYDLALGSVTIVPEKEEEYEFLESYYTGNTVMVTRGDNNGGTSSLSDLADKKVGVVTGTISATRIPKLVPDADLVEFNTTADAKMALEKGKVDAFSCDESIYLAMRWEGINVDRIDEPVVLSDYGIIFKKDDNPELQAQVNQYLADIKADGTHDAMEEKWFGIKEPDEFLSYDDLSGENGTLNIGICSSTKPYTYMKNGKYAGFDVEVLIGFCKEYGYKLQFEDTLFASVLSGVAAGNYDMGVAGFTITDERKQSVDFSDVYHVEDIVVVINGTEEKVTEKTTEDYKKGKIGILQGSYVSTFADEIFPDGEVIEFNSISDMLLALEQGKIDVTPSDNSVYIGLKWEGKSFNKLDEVVDSGDYGIVFPKNGDPKLLNEMNSFIDEIKASGDLEKLNDKWFGEKEPTEMLSYDNLTGENGTIKVGTNSDVKPFIYVKNGKLVGFEIDFLTMFASKYGYKLDIEDVVFPSILAGVVSKKYDIGIAGFTITDERKESVNFSNSHHTEDIILIVKGDHTATGLSQFENATLGVVTGSLYGGYSKEQFPKANIKEFNNFADVLVALKQGKVDGIMLDKPNFNSVARTDSRLSSVTVPAYSVEIGFGFQKNDGGYALQAQMNEFLDKLNAEGKTQAMIDKWYGETEPSEIIPLDELKSNSTTLNVSIDTTRKPFVYMYEGKPVGFEIEVLYMFCKEYGYNVSISDVSFASGLAGLASEKYDLVCGGLYMTPERKESVNFSNPYMKAEVVMATCERSGFDNFILSMKESFDKTFIREARWKLIVEGIVTTLVISLFSVLGGTLLGFALYMLARSKRKWLSKTAKQIAKIYSTIIAGTPTLVILMLLFYVVFTSPDMSGIVVAIVGFVLTFGSFVYDNLELTVSGVDNGQTEAAYALGYSRNKTFFKIVLPQAMKMFVPAYSSEIVNLVKATSVVGYIAVNDLTKMGDIIRGNTYEAFFPLIAVAVIYFMITWIITCLLNILRKKTEPKKRKDKNILKGVVR